MTVNDLTICHCYLTGAASPSSLSSIHQINARNQPLFQGGPKGASQNTAALSSGGPSGHALEHYAFLMGIGERSVHGLHAYKKRPSSKTYHHTVQLESAETAGIREGTAANDMAANPSSFQGSQPPLHAPTPFASATPEATSSQRVVDENQ